MLNFGLNSASFLAQVNVGATPATFLGIFLAVAGAALYFLRSVRPELSRDQDIFFAAVGLLCGFILIFQGWRLDPILQFGQLLLVGTTVFFAVESIRLRSIATQQAKRNTPIVDEERPVSDRYRYSERRNYDAEIEDVESLMYEDEEERPTRRRIPGSRDERSSRDEYYGNQSPRRPASRNNREKPETPDNKRRSGSARPASRTNENYDDENWDTTNSRDSNREVEDWDNPDGETKKPSRRGNNRPQRPSENREDDVVASRPRKRRPSTPRRERDDDDAIPTEYVPYKPIDQSNDESNNSTKLDDEF